MKKILLVMISLAVSNLCAADVLKGNESQLNNKQKQSVELAQEWINANRLASRGNNGAVNFLYGETLPSIVTAPLRGTDVQLEPGEKIRDIQMGDTVRWIVSPSVSGTGESEVSHVIIKPTDVGLSTTLYIYTDRRPYFLQLVSRKNDYMPIVGFDYPEQTKAKWDAYYKQKAKVTDAQTLVSKDSSSPARNLGSLDFDYSIKGDVSWKPVRIYNDGVQTFIQMPLKMKFNEAPALLVLDNVGKEKIVNYRLKDDRFIVDKLFDHAELISGVGDDQEKVEIIRNASTTMKEKDSTNAIAVLSGQKD
ncbi:MAG: P-type conjugative transfer protein TrbG [Bacilli bacterium]|nr:P-type conjugative transfer protein TrbG [Bacilli bacterium]